MRPFPLSPLLLIAACAPDSAPAARSPDAEPPEAFALVDHVDPRIGSGGTGYEVGCGFPGPSTPNGLVKLSPDTADQFGRAFGAYRGGGYHAEDTFIQTFSHMHLYAVGLTDYGLVGLMPVDGMSPDRCTEDGYRAPFDKASEAASPGRYDVRLTDPDVQISLSATPHTGLHRYRFGAGVQTPTVLLDLGHVMDGSVAKAAEVHLDPATGRIWGSMRTDGAMARKDFTVWFEAEVRPLPVAVGTWSTQGVLDAGSTDAAAEADGLRLGAWMDFDQHEVEIQLAISLVDAEGAAANLAAERLSGVEEAADLAYADWDDTLGQIQAWGGSDDDRTIFASAAYHSRMMPTLFSDVDGRYRGFDDAIHSTESAYYTDFSLWDTYRTLHPLMTSIWPEAHADMLDSLGAMVEQGGGLPRWPLATWDGGFMVGTPASVVVAEAWLKGLRPASADALLDQAIAVARGEVTQPYGDPPDVSLLDTYGYYPADLVGRSVANTQEVAISDFAVGLAAQDRGDDAAVVAHLLGRGSTWEQVYNPANGWMHGRNSDGSFTELGNIDIWGDDYAEGNARQYLWMAPHQPERLVEVLGGPDIVNERLIEFFEEAAIDAADDFHGIPEVYYWHGNEVDLHAAWLFAYTGRPDLTRSWVSWIWERWYGTGADGLAGNDDGGTLSAWAVWAGMGLYPLAGTDRYVLGEPRFPRLEVAFGPGHILTLERLGEGPVHSVRLDGAVIDSPDLRHADLVAASSLVFDGR